MGKLYDYIEVHNNVVLKANSIPEGYPLESKMGNAITKLQEWISQDTRPIIYK